MSAEQQSWQYGKVSRAVMVLTVVVMLVLVAAIVLLPFYEVQVGGTETDEFDSSEGPQPGAPWTLPETAAPFESAR
jgi:hypothetical protein